MPQNIPTAPPAQVRVMQIIVVALVMGVVTFGVVAVSMAGAPQPGTPITSYVAVGMAVMVVVVRAIVPRIAAANAVRQSTADLDPANEKDHPQLVRCFTGAFQTRTVMENAFLEGAAFFSLVAYINESQRWILGVTAALVAMMLLSFPTQGKVDRWIVEQFEARQFEP